MNLKTSSSARQGGEGLLRDRLTEAEVAARLRVHKKTLARARLGGRPLLPYVRISPRGIRYDAIAVEAHLERVSRRAVRVATPRTLRNSPSAASRRSRGLKPDSGVSQ